MDRKINVCIIHYNTPFLTECLVKSINKFTPGCNIYIFDNSDKEPFTAKFDNVTIFDNTKGEIIDFNIFLSNYPNRFKSDGKQNRWGSAKHCYSIQKCIELINDEFVLMDSDILITHDFASIIDRKYSVCGSIVTRGKTRIVPFLCYLNVNKMHKLGLTYFNGEKMHGLYVTKDGDNYDTGAWLYEEIQNTSEFKSINLQDLYIHYHGASWHNIHNRRPSVINGIKERAATMLPSEWALFYSNLWSEEKIIVTMTTWSERIKNIPTVLDSIYSQTMLPDKIVINLSSEEFPKKEKSIDDEVIRYIKSHNNIEIFWVDGPNTKQWKKILPTLNRYPDDIIINIDDDKIYENTLIEKLFITYAKNPNNPISGGNCVYHGYQCHTGPCSLIRAKYYSGFEKYIEDEEIFKFYSSDIFFTYLANKNGYKYVYCGHDFETKSKRFNEFKPMHREKASGNKLAIMWNYLTRKFGLIPGDKINKTPSMLSTEKRLANAKKSLQQERKRIHPPRPLVYGRLSPYRSIKFLYHD